MIVQFFMRLHTHDIVPVEQPVQLLTCQGDDLIKRLARPFEFRPFQGLLPHTKAIALPIQYFHFIALAVAEHKQVFGERIQRQCAFDQYAQRFDALPEIYDVPAHVNHRQII